MALRFVAALAVAVAAGFLLRVSEAGEPPDGPGPRSPEGTSSASGGAEPLRSPHGPVTLDCSVCHSPEVWKPARIRDDFDHAAFGFPLTDAHSTVTCRACHVSLEFARAEEACASCHDDVHRGELGVDCGACHSTRTFLDRPEMIRSH